MELILQPWNLMVAVGEIALWCVAGLVMLAVCVALYVVLRVWLVGRMEDV